MFLIDLQEAGVVCMLLYLQNIFGFIEEFNRMSDWLMKLRLSKL